MNVYAFKHTGIYLPGFTVIVADTEDHAKEALRNVLRNAFRDDPSSESRDFDIETIGVLDCSQPGLIEVWNGDY